MNKSLILFFIIASSLNIVCSETRRTENRPARLKQLYVLTYEEALELGIDVSDNGQKDAPYLFDVSCAEYRRAVRSDVEQRRQARLAAHAPVQDEMQSVPDDE